MVNPQMMVAVLPARPFEAEEAFARGRYAKAQSVCDSIVLGTAFDNTDVEQHCHRDGGYQQGYQEPLPGSGGLFSISHDAKVFI